MLLTQNTFYRKYGVWMLPQVMTPAMHDLKFLEFPRDSVYHYLSYDGLMDGPANDDPLLRNVVRAIPVHTPMELTSLEGQPRRMAGSGPTLIRDYLKDHRRMHLAKDLNQAQKDKEVPLVVNYALLVKMYHYQASQLANYQRWKNLFVTMLNEFTMLSKTSVRQHYVCVNSPRTLPSVLQLTEAAKELEAPSIKILREPGGYLLLELWKWFHPGPDDKEPSLLHKLPKDKIHLLNFVYIEGNKWCVINFGVLNSFFLLDGQTAPDPAFVIKAKQHVTGAQMAKRLLRLYMTVMEARNIVKTPEQLAQANPDAGPSDTANLDTEEEIVLDEDGEEVEANPIAVEPGTELPVGLAQQMNDYLPNISLIDEAEFANLDAADFQRVIAEQDAELHQDLLQLEDLAKRSGEQTQYASMADIIQTTTVPPPEAGITQLCDRLAINGAISAAEYRKLTKVANNYKSIKAPFGEGTLEEFLVVPPQDLILDDSASMPDSDVVLDKTMLKSNVNLFDSQYVNKVLHKDIANTIMSVQKTGIAVASYQVEQVRDILGGYEEHVAKLVPVIGQPSTIRFKVPIINEDGNMKTNGVQYKIRKLRGDLPIRKTAPNVVALTSYYGKCFITRGRRNSDNYGYWLQTTIQAQVIDPDNLMLTDALFDNAFDSTLSTAHSYTAISNVLREVTVDGRYRLKFNSKEAAETDGVKRYPKACPTYIGQEIATQAPLFLGSTGIVHIETNEGYEALGSLESFMGIDNQNAPVEYVSARVFGKDMPLGVIMGLDMGLERLLGALKVKPRVVPAGERIKLQAHEYALQFSDETWVFSRADRLASLLLGGFNAYSKSLKLFSVQSFDKRGVYVNLLETNGIGVRFVRELDLMNTMFVDAITRDILIEMKEPTTLQGLFFRSCEMLMTDDHPAELDPAFMRIKGYERISGAIYTELIMAIRQHNGTLGKANASVKMNPYSVWKRISEDPAKLQVTEINPLATLKDAEAVTYLGEGGRGRLSMTKATRGYHANDMGTISEATVDNSDVSVNIHTSADPQFTSLRGMSKRFDLKNPNPTALLSTSALLAPASDHDD